MEWKRDADHAVQEIPIVKTQAPNKSQTSMMKGSLVRESGTFGHLGIG
jgi:hypothetical protein